MSTIAAGVRALITHSDGLKGENDTLRARVAALEALLHSIIDGCVKPDRAHRRAMVDLTPIRAALNRPRISP